MTEGLTGAGSAGGWLVPILAGVVVLTVIVAVASILRIRHHRRRREALETQIADLEGVLVGLAVGPKETEIAVIPGESDEGAISTDSFSPRGPLSTAISILRSDHGPSLPGPDRADLRATCYIYEHLKDPLTPAELADGLNLSLRSLQRGLSSTLGCTPRELILAIKMREAKRCLVEEEARVQEAARAVGFEDPFHFSRRFKSYYGVSPTEMQARMSRSVA